MKRFIKLGNILRRNIEHGTGVEQITVTSPDKSTDSGSVLRDSLTDMESLGEESDEKMDFESGIDLWIIDKDDSEKSLGGSSKIVPSSMKTMNKENIKTRKRSSSKQSLRCFRIRKSVNYQEVSSDSESDNKKKLNRSFDPSTLNRLDSLNATSNHCSKITRSFSSLNKTRVVGSLSSEEISSVLTEGDSSFDSGLEKNRETLLSIENVSNPEKSRDILVLTTNIFSCPICSHRCNNSEELRSHERTHLRDIDTDGSQFTVCNQIKPQESKSANDNKSLCDTDFLASFKNHLISEGNPHLNKICKKTKNKGYEFRHASDHNAADKYSKKTYFCHVCSYSCQEQLVLKTHQILFHSEMKILKCEYCDYKTSQCANLATHIRVHFLLNCPYCDFHSSFKTSFKNHLLTHDNNKAVYKCKNCPYENKSKFLFQKHAKLHKLSKKFKCGSCDEVLPSNKLLQLHKKKHKSKDKSFKCCHCSLLFSDHQSLNVHERSHKPMHVCSICNLSFTQRSQLKTHIKVHTVETFACNKCNSVFQRKYHLIRHMRIHEPEITKCQHCPFECFSDHDFSKHNCINKLYNVQKRPLNFKNVVSKRETNKHKTVKTNENLPKLTDVKSIKNNAKVKTSCLNVNNKKLENKVKVLSRCKNLPSCKSQKIAKCGRNVKYTKGSKQDILVIEENKQNSSSKVNEALTQESRGRKRQCKNKQVIVPSAKRTRRGRLSKSLDVTKILFGKNPTPQVAVSLCSQESFVPCSDHNHSTGIHPMSPLNQNQLRSCGYCRYKSNKKQLLEAHINTAHSWSPKVIRNLFL